MYKDVDEQKRYQQDWYQRNKERVTKSSTERSRARRKVFEEYKRTLSCEFCGEKESVCLDFHHLDPSKKKFTVSSQTNANVDVLFSEVEKCIVVCANCHRKLHAGIITIPEKVLARH